MTLLYIAFPKNFPRYAVGEDFNFFDFLKSFRKWRKSSYPHSRTTKIYKFTHLDGKWAHEWFDPKGFPRSAVGENFNFFDFLKSFRKWRKSSYPHSRTTKIYKFTHLDGKWAHEWFDPKGFPRSAVGENFNFFDFLKSFRKWRKSSYPHSRTTKIYTNSLIWMENGHMSDLTPKSSPGPRWAKTSIFSIFWKVFENEENHHILTLGQLKYTNSLIWKMGTWVIWPQRVPQVRGGRKLQFFRFSEKFSKMKKIIISSL